jgi:type I restriction enzyme S subunit
MRINKIQKNAPNGWKRVSLSEVAHVEMGQSPASTAYNEIGVGLPLIQGNNDIRNDKTISRVWTSEITKTANKGEIILTVRAPVGATGTAHEKICIGRGVCAISSDYQPFIWHFLKYFEPKWAHLEQGSTFTAVNGADIRKIKIELPPLPEQKRIVAVLETWDEVIQKLAKKIEVKKQIKKKLMQKLLSGKIRLSGFKNKWQRISLNDIGPIISGGTPSKKNSGFWKGDIPWISSSDLVDENIRQVFIHRYITQEAVNESATSTIPAESVVIVSRVGVGKLIVNKVPLCTSQDFQSLVIKDSNQYNPYFLAYQLSVELQKLLLRNQGTSIKGFLKNDLRKLSFSVPEIKEQRAIADVFSTADAEIERLERKSKLIQSQKTYLLNHLMTGSIRVPDKIPKP